MWNKEKGFLSSKRENSELWEKEGKFLLISKFSGKTTIFLDWEAAFAAAGKTSWQGEELRVHLAKVWGEREGLSPQEWIVKTRRRLEDKLRKDENAIFLAYSVLRDA